jgi:hypothetical protein
LHWSVRGPNFVNLTDMKRVSPLLQRLLPIVNQPGFAVQRTCGSAALNSADCRRWSAGPAVRTVSRIDWNELLGVGGTRLLDVALLPWLVALAAG